MHSLQDNQSKSGAGENCHLKLPRIFRDLPRISVPNDEPFLKISIQVRAANLEKNENKLFTSLHFLILFFDRWAREKIRENRTRTRIKAPWYKTGWSGERERWNWEALEVEIQSPSSLFCICLFLYFVFLKLSSQLVSAMDSNFHLKTKREFFRYFLHKNVMILD